MGDLQLPAIMLRGLEQRSLQVLLEDAAEEGLEVCDGSWMARGYREIRASLHSDDDVLLGESLCLLRDAGLALRP